MLKKKNLKSQHLHFAHGWLWGVLVLGFVMLMVTGVRDGYFKYWFGGDYKIVNVHEVVQSSREAETLYDVMRQVNIATTVLVGTPNEIIYYDGESGFTGYEENNREILEVQANNPKRFVAFCTIDTTDSDYMSVVEECVEQGAQGFKLHSGHSFFYGNSLDYPGMFEFYAYAQEKGLPVIFHVNTGNYQEEFEAVLKLYPEMKVICPHYCLSSNNLQRLSYLLETYPNLYTDMSFGDETYLLEGVERISENLEMYKELIEKYPNRFFYGTDSVVTDYEGKDDEWLAGVYQVYRDILEKETFTIFFSEDPDQVYNGLALDYEILLQIYEK
ncbi:MAG: amidohydrolase family protein, partial [Candidatus Peregrinibacteria bacterium]|nr:amidohydrolase family protein [Candidatus Peregrinibacteria bacterium]